MARERKQFCPCGAAKAWGQSYCDECKRRIAREAYHRRKATQPRLHDGPQSPPPLSWQDYEAMQEPPPPYERNSGGGRKRED